MPAYTAAQIAVARAMYGVYRTRYDLMTSAAVLGCNDGEDSFLLGARGDHDEAGGIGQWHQARRQMIKQHKSIDVWTAGAVDQARALMAEISEPWSPYRHVEGLLIAAPDLQSKEAVLVSRFEQSAAQVRDIQRRTKLAEYWLEQAKSWEAVS